MFDPDKLIQSADTLEAASKKADSKALDALQDAADQVAKSFCGSWLGYHSRVYYKDLRPVPPGARFSVEWGFGDRMSNETRGEWTEWDFDSVVQEIEQNAGAPKSQRLESAANRAFQIFEHAQSQALSALASFRTEHPTDNFLESHVTKVTELKKITYANFVRFMRGTGQVMSRDAIAAHAGFQTPPHCHVIAQVMAWREPFDLCAKLAKLVRQIGSHVSILDKKAQRSSRVGTHVFIGHGRSAVWKDLRDFIRDRLALPWDEFNRVPVAGVTNIARLSQMLDEASIAFLVLTAEDEQANGQMHARMNVIHEAGLFQGRLGFARAILLVEEGCEEFSNVQGLGQIRFPRGKIAEKFEDIRAVLEREGIIDASS